MNSAVCLKHVCHRPKSVRLAQIVFGYKGIFKRLRKKYVYIIQHTQAFHPSFHRFTTEDISASGHHASKLYLQYLCVGCRHQRRREKTRCSFCCPIEVLLMVHCLKKWHFTLLRRPVVKISGVSIWWIMHTGQSMAFHYSWRHLIYRTICSASERLSQPSNR